MDENTQPMTDDAAPDESAAAGDKATKVADAKTKKRWAEFRQRTDVCKAYRKKLIRNWTVNIDYRRGKQFASQTDDDTVSVNLDWSYTKTKEASLFSQVPKVRVDHAPESLTAGPWVAAFERRLNDLLVEGGIEAAASECLPDVINAAGFAVVLASYESLTRDKEVPSMDLSIFPPEIQKEALRTGHLFGKPVPMDTVPEKVDARYVVRRISPADFLWPVDFTGSDFDNAPWLGYSGRLPWAEAQARFKLTDEDKVTVLGDDLTTEDRLSNDYDREHLQEDGKVGFDEIFYHEFQYDSEATSFKTLHHLVFVHGKTEPVKDEPWQGQLVDPSSGKLVGSTKSPLRVLTLTYITDEDLPPSDSAIARSQINELNKGRTHNAKQRARNIPSSWFDVNRLDPAIQNALMRGTWQHAIPVQGDGSRVIGNVQQSVMPQDNMLFDRIAKDDAADSWGIGSNQMGGGGDIETKGEANIVQTNFQTRVGRERARVAAFIVGIAEVLGGLMCLYEDPNAFGQGFDPAISQRLAYSILADSTVLVDANQRLERLNNYIDKYAKSGWINLEGPLKEIATLIGLDPTTTVVAPQPQTPPPPNISLRLTGGDDMMNPLLLAFMIKSGLAPEQELIQKAMELIKASVQLQPPAQAQAPAQPGEMPQPLPPNVGDANPNAGLLPAIGDRSEPGGQQ